MFVHVVGTDGPCHLCTTCPSKQCCCSQLLVSWPFQVLGSTRSSRAQPALGEAFCLCLESFPLFCGSFLHPFIGWFVAAGYRSAHMTTDGVMLLIFSFPQVHQPERARARLLRRDSLVRSSVADIWPIRFLWRSAILESTFDCDFLRYSLPALAFTFVTSIAWFRRDFIVGRAVWQTAGSVAKGGGAEEKAPRQGDDAETQEPIPETFVCMSTAMLEFANLCYCAPCVVRLWVRSFF